MLAHAGQVDPSLLCAVGQAVRAFAAQDLDLTWNVFSHDSALAELRFVVAAAERAYPEPSLGDASHPILRRLLMNMHHRRTAVVVGHSVLVVGENFFCAVAQVAGAPSYPLHHLNMHYRRPADAAERTALVLGENSFCAEAVVAAVVALHPNLRLNMHHRQLVAAAGRSALVANANSFYAVAAVAVVAAHS